MDESDGGIRDRMRSAEGRAVTTEDGGGGRIVRERGRDSGGGEERVCERARAVVASAWSMRGRGRAAATSEKDD
jgi:hypothetical protein